jgi:hypothetical protein
MLNRLPTGVSELLSKLSGGAMFKQSLVMALTSKYDYLISYAIKGLRDNSDF